MITPATPIIGTGGTVDAVLRYLQREHGIVASGKLLDYLTELHRLCTLIQFRFDILASQSYHECFNPDTGKPWDSKWFRERLNPAGLGITGDPQQNAASPTFATGEDAARAQIVHMAHYVVPFDAEHADWWDGPAGDEIAEYQHLDPRWRDVHDAGFAGSVRVLGDLGNGRWAVDPEYAAHITRVANAIFKETPMPDVTFHQVPDPGIKQMICAKPYDGAGFTRVAPRQPVGVCEHITAGYGTAQWYSDFFSTGGERQYDALVDFVVDRKGTIGMLNDPWGTRSPWANGRTDGLEGDGPAFLARFGINGVNDRLISIEHEGMPADVWPQAQWEASVKLTAYLYDRMKVRWDSFPVHQDYGVVTHMLHSEFTGKGGNALDECPGRYLKGRITQFQTEVRNYMKSFQVGAEVPAKPLPKPEPVTIYPAGMDLGIAKTLFGKLRKHQVGKPTTAHGFNPNGGVSLAWLERGAKEGQFPQGGDWYTFEEERELIVFTNGWVLWRPSKRAGWRWVGDAADVKAA